MVLVVVLVVLVVVLVVPVVSVVSVVSVVPVSASFSLEVQPTRAKSPSKVRDRDVVMMYSMWVLETP